MLIAISSITLEELENINAFARYNFSYAKGEALSKGIDIYNMLRYKGDSASDRVTRQMAEFDNFRKRTEREKSAMYEIGAKAIVEKLLPVVDNFERGFSTVADEDKDDAFVKGMEMVYKQMMTMLESVDVKPIEAVGKEFNPDLHNAVMHVEDETVGENIIVEEFQKGYTYRDSVVRYSMVKVAN